MISFYEKADIRKKYKYPLNLLTMAMCSEDNKHELYKGKAKYSGPMLDLDVETIDNVLTLCILDIQPLRKLNVFLDYFKHPELTAPEIVAKYPEAMIKIGSLYSVVPRILKMIMNFNNRILPEHGKDIVDILSRTVVNTKERLKQFDALGFKNTRYTSGSVFNISTCMCTMPSKTLEKAKYTFTRDIFPENVSDKLWEKGICSVADLLRYRPIDLVLDSLIPYGQLACEEISRMLLQNFDACFSADLKMYDIDVDGVLSEFNLIHIVNRNIYKNDSYLQKFTDWPMNLYYCVFRDPKYLFESVSVLPDDWEESVNHILTNTELTDQDRDVICLYLKDKLSFEVIGKEYYNLSASRIHQIFHCALRKLLHPTRSGILEYGLKGYEEHNKRLEDERICKQKTHDDSMKYLLDTVLCSHITTDDINVQDLNRLHELGIVTYGNVLSYEPFEFSRKCRYHNLYEKVYKLLKEKYSIVVSSISGDDQFKFTYPYACSIRKLITNKACYRYNTIDELLSMSLKKGFNSCGTSMMKDIEDASSGRSLISVFNRYDITRVSDIIFYKPSSIKRICRQYASGFEATKLFTIIKNNLQIDVDKETDTWIYDEHYLSNSISLDDIYISSHVDDTLIHDQPEWRDIISCLKINGLLTLGSIVRTTPHLLNHMFTLYEKGKAYDSSTDDDIEILTSTSIVSVEFISLLTFMNNKFKIFMSIDSRTEKITDWIFRSTDYLLMKPGNVVTSLVQHRDTMDTLTNSSAVKYNTPIGILAEQIYPDQPVLSVRAITCLRRAGIATVEDLLNHTPTELMKIRNMGRITLENIMDVIRVRYGIELPDDELDL